MGAKFSAPMSEVDMHRLISLFRECSQEISLSLDPSREITDSPLDPRWGGEPQYFLELLEYLRHRNAAEQTMRFVRSTKLQELAESDSDDLPSIRQGH